jgi:enamine deaminase RidA (YjgF/YER057c/UK114 family)
MMSRLRVLTFSVGLLTTAAIWTAPHTLASSPQQPTDPAAKQIFVPPGMEGAYDAVHYAPVVRVGNMVIVSGVPAAGPGEFEDQLRRMFGRIKDNLVAAGASLEDVVELESFHRGAPDTAAFQAEFRRVRQIHGEFFKDNYPAWTAVGNSVLLAQNALVEMKAVAIVGAGKGAVVHRGK